MTSVTAYALQRENKENLLKYAKIRDVLLKKRISRIFGLL